MNKLITSYAVTFFASADQILEVPVVQNTGFDDAIDEAEIQYMSFKDLASFNFMFGFVERAIDL